MNVPLEKKSKKIAGMQPYETTTESLKKYGIFRLNGTNTPLSVRRQDILWQMS
jgi:hypothetical protein